MQGVDTTAMRLALDEARAAAQQDEVPVGAVILRDEEVIARAHNRILETGDPTAHAELLAIRQAVVHSGSRWLTGCTLYVTLEPCAMCAGALVLTRISRLVFGAFDPKTGACGSLRNIVEDRRLNHRLTVARGVLENECRVLLRDFFQDLRKKHSQERC